MHSSPSPPSVAVPTTTSLLVEPSSVPLQGARCVLPAEDVDEALLPHMPHEEEDADDEDTESEMIVSESSSRAEYKVESHKTNLLPNDESIVRSDSSVSHDLGNRDDSSISIEEKPGSLWTKTDLRSECSVPDSSVPLVSTVEAHTAPLVDLSNESHELTHAHEEPSMYSTVDLLAPTPPEQTILPNEPVAHPTVSTSGNELTFSDASDSVDSSQAESEENEEISKDESENSEEETESSEVVSSSVESSSEEELDVSVGETDQRVEPGSNEPIVPSAPLELIPPKEQPLVPTQVSSNVSRQTLISTVPAVPLGTLASKPLPNHLTTSPHVTPSGSDELTLAYALPRAA